MATAVVVEKTKTNPETPGRQTRSSYPERHDDKALPTPQMGAIPKNTGRILWTPQTAKVSDSREVALPPDPEHEAKNHPYSFC